MTSLANRISQLLFDYDCVIVPELGGFITNYKPAYIDEHLSMMHPPSKALGFNSNLNKSDGLLANYISSEDDISFEEASERIKSEVERCFEKLNEGKRVEFDKVGILYMDSTSKIHFDPDDSINYLTSSFGLHKFYFPQKAEHGLSVARDIQKSRAEETTPIIPIETQTKKEEVILTPVTSTGSSNFKYWAAAILLPMILYLGLVTWQSDFVNDGTIHQTDFNPFKLLKQKEYNLRPSTEIVLEEVEIPPYVLPEKSPPASEELVINEESPSKPENAPLLEESIYASQQISSLKFHVINGCFSVQENAEKQTQRLREKGFSAHIIDKKGRLYRVSQGSFSDKESALNLLRNVRKSENKDSWLLKK